MAAIGQFPVFQLKIGNATCVAADQYHHRHQLPEGIRLVKAENEGEPVFGIILNHDCGAVEGLARVYHGGMITVTLQPRCQMMMWSFFQGST